MDFSQILLEKINMIAEQWVEAVRLDRKVSSANHLSGSAIQNHVPKVLEAIASALSYTEENNIELIIKESISHGVMRAAQGFTPTEIVQEYHLLRQEIFSTLAPELLKGTVPEVIQVYNRINATIDAAISQCFKSYVEKRLQELHELRSQAELTNQELSRLVKSHQDNLSQLAHEIKNPLNSIIGYSELFLRTYNRNIEVRDNVPNLEHIERILRNGRQLLRLINDTLEISRYSAGKIKLCLEEVDIGLLISNVVEVLEPLASEKQLQIVINCDRAPETVVTDPLRLQQIITNLLSNAIRYTNSGIIKLTCQKLNDNDWCIEVMDTGIGIAPEDQIYIFEPFFQAKNRSGSEAIGTGLGLAIVSQLVNLMQGKIELVSELEVGSTFTVTLPLEINFIENGS
jgi:signal transduction histidine kinase